MKRLLLITSLFAVVSSLTAQQKPLPSYAPSRNEMLERYKVADQRDSLARKTAFKLSVTPNWSGPSAFWYRNALPDSQSEYLYVDPVKNIKRPLFDAAKMAAAISSVQGKAAEANRLPIRNAYLYPDGKKWPYLLDVHFLM